MISAGSAFASNPLWYTTRATGIIAFVLLTATFAMGLAATKRTLASRRWPRFATQQLHRNVSLLAVLFVCVHIATTLADSYVRVGWWSWTIPGVAGYRPFWVTLGTLAFDLTIVVAITSVIRDRMGARLWRTIHLTSYAAWPLAFLHFLGTGTDAAHRAWGLYLDIACLLVLGFAAAARWLTSDEPIGPLRSLHGSHR